MPGKNLVRQFSADAYYHVYNRGVDKKTIFVDEDDYKFFSSLFARSAGPKPGIDRYGRECKWLGDEIEVLAFCWMPNHYHLLLFQKDNPKAISELMQGVGTAYTMYYNKKYKRKGTLLESSYKASLITDDDYFAHITRYIHLNPKEYKSWRYSSYPDYANNTVIHDWVHPDYILGNFADRKEYSTFVADYQDNKKSLDIIKHELANQ